MTNDPSPPTQSLPTTTPDDEPTYISWQWSLLLIAAIACCWIVLSSIPLWDGSRRLNDLCLRSLRQERSAWMDVLWTKSRSSLHVKAAQSPNIGSLDLRKIYFQPTPLLKSCTSCLPQSGLGKWEKIPSRM